MQVSALQTSLAERKESFVITTELERFSEQVSIYCKMGGIEHVSRHNIEPTFLPCTGAFGEVRMCVHRESGAQRAVKVLRKSHMDDDEKRMLFNEINILKEIDHPNIIKMYEFFEDEKRYYLVTEICKGGELFDEILQRGKFSERDGAVLMKQVLSCINYCHQSNIVHRDLKPENILLEQNKEFDQIKIIDFGTSLVYDPNRNLDEKLGTPYYIAPEVLNKNYNEKCDIWSAGVITYILLSGMPPFNGQSD